MKFLADMGISPKATDFLDKLEEDKGDRLLF
jgi:hypothetical protein